MSTQEEKQLDDFVRKVITEQRLDEPSPSFVNNVMRKVVAASHKDLCIQATYKYSFMVFNCYGTCGLVWLYIFF